MEEKAMTIQDKIAALPPKCPSFEIVNGEVRYRYPERLFRAEAERDLALEVLRNLDKALSAIPPGRYSVREIQDWMNATAPAVFDARAVLAACEGREP